MSKHNEGNSLEQKWPEKLKKKMDLYDVNFDGQTRVIVHLKMYLTTLTLE